MLMDPTWVCILCKNRKTVHPAVAAAYRMDGITAARRAHRNIRASKGARKAVRRAKAAKRREEGVQLSKPKKWPDDFMTVQRVPEIMDVSFVPGKGPGDFGVSVAYRVKNLGKLV